MWSSLMLLTLWTVSAVCLSDNLESMNTMQLLSAFGAPGESHDVFTQDGYILTIHRLQPRGPGTKPPVLLQHGMMGVSDCWVLMGPERDLAFLLWQEGYDVWLGNVRGTTYGKRHVNKTTKHHSFWQFSFHEMGYYDMPAVIDYILKLTRHPDLYYVGQSMGTTMFYIMCSTRPEYNKKIRVMFSLAPVAFMSNVANWYRQLSKYRHQIYETAMSIKLYEAFPKVEWLRRYAANICRDGSPMQDVCSEVFFFVFGYDNIQLNKTMFPSLVKHLASTSTNTLMHYSQNIISGEFQMYDYGKTRNLKVYGRRKPPSYNLALVTAPVVLHYSTNDLLSNEKDVNRLASLLPNVVGKFLVPFKYFNHIDYMWSKDVKELLYNDIIEIMRQML